MNFDFDSPRNGRQIVNEAFEAFYGNPVRTGYRFSRIDRSEWTRLDYALERYDGYLSEYNTVSFQGDIDRGILQYNKESKFLADITDLIYSKYKKLYHITPARNFRSIEKKGLIPRSYNKRSDYPDRVYFLKTDNAAEYESLAKSSNPDIHEWSLLEIDISREPVTGRRYRFYNDPFMNNAVFTYDNIHPGLVTLKRTFRI